MEKPSECIGCPLYEKGNGFSIPEGFPGLKIGLVGEALGANEAKAGRPFVRTAQAGSKLEEIFRLTSYPVGRKVERANFRIWNIVGCQPPGNFLDGAPWEKGAIDHCKVHFDKVFRPFPPTQEPDRVLVAMGNVALRVLTGVSGIASEKQSIYHLRGFFFPTKYGWVIPSFHPSFLKRGKPGYTPLNVLDLTKAIQLAAGIYTKPLPTQYHPKYIEYPSYDEARNFYRRVKENPNLTLYYDIETPLSSETEEDEREDLTENDLITVQFSLGKEEGISIPYTDELYQKVCRATLKLSNPKVAHNGWNFDNPRLRAKGFTLGGNECHDSMWGFKHLHPGLPRGLQSIAANYGFPFPWKHYYGSKLAWYGCVDVDTLAWIWPAIKEELVKDGLWQGYERHTRGLYEVLHKASVRGLPVNEEKRVALGVSMGEKLVEEDVRLQTLVPEECRNLSPRRGNKTDGYEYGYKRTPGEVAEAIERYRTAVVRAGETGRQVTKPEQEFVTSCTGLTKTPEGLWCRVEPFVPSSEQVKRYIKFKQEELLKSPSTKISVGGELITQRKLAKMYEIPTIRRRNAEGVKEERETTGAKEIEHLYYLTGDPLFESVRRYRSIQTTLTNFVPNWSTGNENRVHTEWGFTAASGQIDSKRPNILNASKRSEFGRDFSRIIEAPEGYTFVSGDYRSFHVAIMGFVAEDAEYIRFSQLDPHSMLVSWITPDVFKPVDLSWNDADILAYCAEIKKWCKESKAKDPLHGVDLRQETAKPAVLGNQLGLGPRKLWMQNRRAFTGISHAAKVQAALNEPFPKVLRRKNVIMEMAHETHRLKNYWHRQQEFYDVFNWHMDDSEGRWIRGNGMDAERAIAFDVQSNAFGMIQENILQAEERGLNDEHNFMCSVHDSVVYMPETRKVDRCIEEINAVYNIPCATLTNRAAPNGLSVGLEISIGQNWGDMKEI